MKKKIVRKVSSAKKSISKKNFTKKKKFSLKSWLLGGLVLLLVSAYGLYQYNLQPKGIKVLEVSGILSEYIPANPVDINIVQSLKNSSIPKSEDPTAYAMAVANQYVRQQVAAGKKVDPDKVEIVTKQATVEAYQAGAASGAISTSEAVKAVKEKDNDGKTVAEKEAEIAAEKINSLNYVKNASGQVVVEPKAPTSSQPVTDKKTCQTAAGFSVYEGETMIGLVVAGKDSIVECSNGRWVPLTAADGTACYKGDPRPECKITVKPIYQQQEDGSGANCYIEGGSVVVGNGSVVESDGSKGKQCRGTKDLIEVVNYEGKWITPQEATNIENFKKSEEEKRLKEESATDAVNAKNCNGTYNAESNVCTPKAEALKVVNSKGTKTGGELTTNSRDCIYGATPTGRGDSRSAEYRCNDSTGKVPQTSEKCQAQGTVVVCKVYDSSGKYLSEYRKSPETVKNEVNPGAKLLGGEITIDDKDCLYGSTPALDGSGNRLAGKYVCNNEKGEKPRTLTELSFGNNPPLPPAAQQKLTDPNKPWSATNPVAVPRSANCPPGSSSSTIYASNTSDTKYCYPDPNLNKLPAGAECDVAGVNNSACQSNSCRKMTKPGDSDAKFYCIPESTYKTDVRRSDGTILYKNGTVCRSGSDCASGFCADFAFSWSNIDSQNRCIDNPFISSTSLLNTQPLVTNSQSAPDKKEVDEEVVSPSDCESGKAAFIKYQPGGKNFRCKPASFCPEQDIAKEVTCYEDGDPICTSGQPWEPGVDCLPNSNSNSNSNQLNAVGTLNDSTNPNSETLGPVLPQGYQIQLQTSSDIKNINLNINNVNTPYDTTVNTSGCAPTTVLNAARYLEQKGIISPIQLSNYELMDELITNSNFVIKCTSNGCASGADAMLKVLEDKFGIEGAFQAYTNNRITSANQLLNTDGIFLYQGDVADSTKVIQNDSGYYGHNSMFICEDGKCVAIDSYTGGGEPQECTPIDNNNMQCGTTTYKLSTESRTVGGPSAAYLLPVTIN